MTFHHTLIANAGGHVATAEPDELWCGETPEPTIDELMARMSSTADQFEADMAVLFRMAGAIEPGEATAIARLRIVLEDLRMNTWDGIW